MLHAAGPALVRVAAVVPVILVLLFIGPMWLLGLVLSKGRRQYVVEITDRVLQTVEVMIQGYDQRRSTGSSVNESRSRAIRPAA